VVIEFLAKPSADQTQENLIDRLLDLIYQIAMVANINDERFGNASGVALEFKLQPMRNLAIMKERKFKSSIQERYKMVFALPTNIQSVYRDEWLNIKYQFTRNIPRNIAEEAQVASQLNGLVSQSTMLSTLSIVDDVKDEIAKIDEEGISINMSDFELSNRLGSE
jgi:SPP1 family phage portal protein